ncbi:hypothetical protein ZIOFF_001957 [Zingiber officinale]|uniref:Expansin-like CBD domain-containing protein n=1 Tax=Zingiber officinale TaxID=94328 RepID=A0A8J5LYT4_ZINOF|nr:hypothetical protein ZIOFF_001957 [Zingiber officinale]
MVKLRLNGLRRTILPCSYRGFNVAFRVDAGLNAKYLAIVIENVNGDGELTAVELKEGLSGTWIDASILGSAVE